MNLYHYHPLADEVYRVPVLIVMATTDWGYILDMVPGQSFIEFLLKRRRGLTNPHATFEMIDDAGHYSMLETPVRVARPASSRSMWRPQADWSAWLRLQSVRDFPQAVGPLFDALQGLERRRKLVASDIFQKIRPVPEGPDWPHSPWPRPRAYQLGRLLNHEN
jgi:hypothetical protein